MEHIRRHNQKKLYECTLCEKHFSFKDSLSRHIDAIHYKLKPFSCTLCDKSFARKSILTKHRKVHNRPKFFSSTLSDKSFAVSDKLGIDVSTVKMEWKNGVENTGNNPLGNDKTSHVSKLRKKKRRKGEQGTINVKGKQSKTMYYHERKMNKRQGKSRLQSGTNNFTHRHHGKAQCAMCKSEKVWKCRMCEWHRIGDKYTRHVLLTHFIHEHTQIIGPTCVICNGEITMDKIGLDHILSHTSMQCALCKQEGIPTIPDLEEHLTEKHSGEIVCPVCKSQINESDDIVHHMMMHQRETDKRKCPTCLRYHQVPKLSVNLYRGNSRLVMHNTKLGTIQCPLCAFTTQAGRDTMKIHLSSTHRDYFHSVGPLGKRHK